MGIEDVDYLLQNTVKNAHIINVDSSMRDKRAYPTPSEFTVDFDTPFSYVFGLDILDVSMPSSMWNIENTNNRMKYQIFWFNPNNMRDEFTYNKLNHYFNSYRFLEMYKFKRMSDLMIQNKNSRILFIDHSQLQDENVQNILEGTQDDNLLAIRRVTPNVNMIKIDIINDRDVLDYMFFRLGSAMYMINRKYEETIKEIFSIINDQFESKLQGLKFIQLGKDVLNYIFILNDIVYEIPINRSIDTPIDINIIEHTQVYENTMGGNQSQLPLSKCTRLTAKQMCNQIELFLLRDHLYKKDNDKIKDYNTKVIDEILNIKLSVSFLMVLDYNVNKDEWYFKPTSEAVTKINVKETIILNTNFDQTSFKKLKIYDGSHLAVNKFSVSNQNLTYKVHLPFNCIINIVSKTVSETTLNNNICSSLLLGCELYKINDYVTIYHTEENLEIHAVYVDELKNEYTQKENKSNTVTCIVIQSNSNYFVRFKQDYINIDDASYYDIRLNHFNVQEICFQSIKIKRVDLEQKINKQFKFLCYEPNPDNSDKYFKLRLPLKPLSPSSNAILNGQIKKIGSCSKLYQIGSTLYIWDNEGDSDTVLPLRIRTVFETILKDVKNRIRLYTLPLTVNKTQTHYIYTFNYNEEQYHVLGDVLSKNPLTVINVFEYSFDNDIVVFDDAHFLWFINIPLKLSVMSSRQSENASNQHDSSLFNKVSNDIMIIHGVPHTLYISESTSFYQRGWNEAGELSDVYKTQQSIINNEIMRILLLNDDAPDQPVQYSMKGENDKILTFSFTELEVYYVIDYVIFMNLLFLSNLTNQTSIQIIDNDIVFCHEVILPFKETLNDCIHFTDHQHLYLIDINDKLLIMQSNLSRSMSNVVHNRTIEFFLPYFLDEIKKGTSQYVNINIIRDYKTKSFLYELIYKGIRHRLHIHLLCTTLNHIQGRNQYEHETHLSDPIFYVNDNLLKTIITYTYRNVSNIEYINITNNDFAIEWCSLIVFTGFYEIEPGNYDLFQFIEELNRKFVDTSQIQLNGQTTSFPFTGTTNIKVSQFNNTGPVTKTGKIILKMESPHSLFVIDLEKSTLRNNLGFSVLSSVDKHTKLLFQILSIPLFSHELITCISDQNDSRQIIGPPGVVFLLGNRYVSLRCPEIEDIIGSHSIGRYSTGIGIFILGLNQQTMTQRLDFVNYIKKPFHPIEKLKRLTFRFETSNGNLYDFKGVDMFMIVQINNYIPVKKTPFNGSASLLNPNYNPDFLEYCNKENRKKSDVEKYENKDENKYEGEYNETESEDDNIIIKNEKYYDDESSSQNSNETNESNGSSESNDYNECHENVNSLCENQSLFNVFNS
jgi:hypothetical protein